MRRGIEVALGVAAAAGGLACFNPTAPPAPCSGYASCPDGWHCDTDPYVNPRLCRPNAIPPAVISSFTASATRARCGSAITLAAGFSGGNGSIDQGVGAVNDGDTRQVGLTAPAAGASIDYTLTVTNAEGRPTKSAVSVSVSDLFLPGPTLATSGSEGATATRLRCGKVLIAGGSGGRTAVLFDSAKAGDAAVAPIAGASGTGLSTGRSQATATLLRDGRVLIAGGSDDGSAELFAGKVPGSDQQPLPDLSTSWDRCSGQFFATGSLRTPRWFATATLLPGGKVLIAGGGDGAGGAPLASAELFDPAADGGKGSFSAAGTLLTARTGAMATLLLDGRVLIAGGVGAGGAPLTSAELYDPDANGGAGAFLPAGGLAEPRNGATATLLSSGRVLVAGGSAGLAGARTGALASAELYLPAADRSAGSFTSAGARLVTARSDASAVLLGNGQVLITGGRDARGVHPLASAELYDPAGGDGTGSFSVISGTCGPAQQRLGATSTLLPDGKVLVAGGQDSTFSSEIFDPAGLGPPPAGPGPALDLGSFRKTGWQTSETVRSTATLLLDGRVLLAGGTRSPGVAGESAMLFEPGRGLQPDRLIPAAELATPREGATATLLGDGRVLIAGGRFGTACLDSAEIYTPASDGPGRFAPTGPLQAARADAAAVLLPDGRVAVFGGRSTGTDPVLDTAEVFDPAANGGLGTFSQLERRLMTPGFSSTATLLPTGEVLIAGGTGPGGDPLATAQLFDPAGNSGAGTFRWTGRPPKGTLLHPRSSAAAALLPDGKVLLAGGFGEGGGPGGTAELYDVSSEAFLSAGDLPEARALAATALLPSGKALIVGGSGAAGLLASFVLFDPFAAKFLGPTPLEYLPGAPRPRLGSLATLLQDGRVLVAGGEYGVDSTPDILFYGLE